MENYFSPYGGNIYLSTAKSGKLITFPQGPKMPFDKLFFHSFFLHIPQPLWRKLQTRVNISCNVPNVILQRGVAALQSGLYLADGIQDSRVVSSEFFTDVRQAQVGELADQINGDLPGLSSALILQSSPKDIFVNGVEVAHLADD